MKNIINFKNRKSKKGVGAVPNKVYSTCTTLKNDLSPVDIIGRDEYFSIMITVPKELRKMRKKDIQELKALKELQLDNDDKDTTRVSKYIKENISWPEV